MSTIYEIAKLAGVSPTTVSKVINNYPDVSDKTRKNIKRILKEESFFPNSQAQFLSTKKTWTLGIVYYEDVGVGLSHSFFSNVIEAVKKQSEIYGYSLLFGSKTDRLKNNTFLDYFKYRCVDGIVIICSDINDKETLEMIESDFPIVVIDMFNKNTSTVMSDNIQGCKLAVDYLYELGHTQIAHIAGTYQTDNLASATRIEGFIEAMKRLNLKIPKEYIVNGINFEFDGGYKAMNELIKLKDRPTAVFAGSDKIALGAIEAIKEAGLRVPEDFSIIGFDDIEISRYVTPKLTTIRQQCDEIGKEAIEILVKQINEKSKMKINKIIPVKLVERESCRRLNTK